MMISRPNTETLKRIFVKSETHCLQTFHLIFEYTQPLEQKNPIVSTANQHLGGHRGSVAQWLGLSP